MASLAGGRIMIRMLILLFPCVVGADVASILNISVHQQHQKIMVDKMEFLTDLITSNIKSNGWSNIIIFGKFPNILYRNLQKLHFTFTISNNNNDDYYIEDTVPYHSNIILIDAIDFANFEDSLLHVMGMPYWTPHAKIYLYYRTKDTAENVARIFFIFWYYRACNVILIQDYSYESLHITQFSPYISDGYQLDRHFGCWTARKLGMPINTFEEGFICVQNCHNVTINSKLRNLNLGTCIGYMTQTMPLSDRKSVRKLNLFPDKGRNFHGFAFTGFVTEVPPFMLIPQQPDGTYKLGSRDGNIWSAMAQLLNFTIDLTQSLKVLKKSFNFDVNIRHIFSVAHRKGDLILTPIYQFDVIVVKIDYSFAYKESGVCFMSHRADYETVFDFGNMMSGNDMVVRASLSLLCIWFVFCIYSGTENRISMDFLGKNLLNAIRSVFLINLLHPPRRTSFRIFLIINIWSFFIINFAMQAAITSFFTVSKRGREVDTFEDIIEKGYKIEGVSSPDVVLPDTEERFRLINSKLSPIADLFGCVNELSNDSQRFCLIDCAVGRYLQRNKLNEDGEQYLHIAEDRVHSHYLNFIFPKHSVISDNFSKYLMAFFEAGLIKKWEDYRFNNIKEEASIKPLALKDISAIFQINAALTFMTMCVFTLELILGNIANILVWIPSKTKKLSLRRKRN